jgi:hypothetical protein
MIGKDISITHRRVKHTDSDGLTSYSWVSKKKKRR